MNVANVAIENLRFVVDQTYAGPAIATTGEIAGLAVRGSSFVATQSNPLVRTVFGQRNAIAINPIRDGVAVNGGAGTVTIEDNTFDGTLVTPDAAGVLPLRRLDRRRRRHHRRQRVPRRHLRRAGALHDLADDAREQRVPRRRRAGHRSERAGPGHDRGQPLRPRRDAVPGGRRRERPDPVRRSAPRHRRGDAEAAEPERGAVVLAARGRRQHLHRPRARHLGHERGRLHADGQHASRRARARPTSSHLVLSNKSGSSNSHQLAPQPLAIAATGNTFGSLGANVGTHVALWNHAATFAGNPAPYGTLSFASNVFAGQPARYFALDASSCASSQTLACLPAFAAVLGYAGYPATPVAPFAGNVSAASNTYDGVAPAAMNVVQRVALQDRTFHNDPTVPDRADLGTALGIVDYGTLAAPAVALTLAADAGNDGYTRADQQFTTTVANTGGMVQERVKLRTTLTRLSTGPIVLDGALSDSEGDDVRLEFADPGCTVASGNRVDGRCIARLDPVTGGSRSATCSRRSTRASTCRRRSRCRPARAGRSTASPAASPSRSSCTARAPARCTPRPIITNFLVRTPIDVTLDSRRPRAGVRRHAAHGRLRRVERRVAGAAALHRHRHRRRAVRLDHGAGQRGHVRRRGRDHRRRAVRPAQPGAGSRDARRRACPGQPDAVRPRADRERHAAHGLGADLGRGRDVHRSPTTAAAPRRRRRAATRSSSRSRRRTTPAARPARW